jgi:ATP-dependent Clp protease protease subunit
MNAKKAVELGFADKVLYTDAAPEGDALTNAFIFGRRTVFNSLLAKLPKAALPPTEPPPEPDVPADTLCQDTLYIEETRYYKNQFEII